MSQPTIYAFRGNALSVFAVAPGVREILVVPEQPGPILIRIIGISQTVLLTGQEQRDEAVPTSDPEEEDLQEYPTPGSGLSDELTVLSPRQPSSARAITPQSPNHDDGSETETDSITLENLSHEYGPHRKAIPREHISKVLDGLSFPRLTGDSACQTTSTHFIEAHRGAGQMASPAKSVASSVTESEADSVKLENLSLLYAICEQPVPRQEITRLLDRARWPRSGS
ncbi:hypothetical protein FA95DRAFT_1560273 [Auriscalpium vulgare]|uniref:Uncharacterized protein n=1 Tax=Auriscalpium vulgare TaxID=40419 RepID=A0ACB8RQN3_9AGAM|nr:hypothetical protein FA95DRAFT_1560273 [Auriscalpium vulgare]